VIQAEIVVDEVLDPQDACYSIREDLMWYACGVAALLKETKDTGLVRGVGRFKYTSIYLVLYGFTEEVIDAWGNGDIVLSPGCVRNCRYLDGWEEVFAEMTALRIVPGKCVLMYHHEVVKKVSFGGPEESWWVSLVDDIMALVGIATGRGERWWIRVQYW